MAKKYYKQSVDPYYDEGHEVGSFPQFIGEMPPEEYLYDPRQSFNAEEIGPLPPGREKEYLLLDENITNPNYLPTNSAGETRFPEGPEYGPEPPTFHATNVPETAQKWGKAGQDYTFLAESPQAVKTAEELGAPRVMRGYDPALDQTKRPDIGPEPKQGELDEMGQFNQFWNHYVTEKYGGKDLTQINPAEEGLKAEEELTRKYGLELLNREGTADYKKYEKLIEEGKKDAIKAAEWKRTGAMEDKRMAKDFFKQKLKAEQKQPKELDTRANVEAAQKYTEQALYGPNSWANYELTPEDLEKMGSDKAYVPKNRKIKERILVDINRVRERAGLPKLTEKPVEVPMVEYRDWGLFRTGEKKTTEPGFRYEEGQAPTRRSATPGAAPQVVRTGTDRRTGKKVIQYSDGRVEYAP